MKKKIKLFLIAGIFLANISNASMIGQLGNTNNNNNNLQQSDIYGKYIPYFQLPASVYVQRKRFEINTENLAIIYQKYFKKIYARKKVLTNTFNISILKTPVVKILKPISHIYVNPVYIQQIILPKKDKITSAISSVPFAIFSYQNNELHFKVKSNFSFGNIIIYYTDGKNNYSLNILVDNYFQKQCMLINNKYFCKKPRKKFAMAYSNFALIYKFKNIKPLPPLQAILLYEKLTGKKVTDIKNNSFVTFNYKDLTYFIYRNDKFGNIIINNKKFFVKP